MAKSASSWHQTGQNQYANHGTDELRDKDWRFKGNAALSSLLCGLANPPLF
jgi:hypothetical protein